MVNFLLKLVNTIFKKKIDFNELRDQLYWIGFRSILLTAVTGIFVGAILAIQIYVQIKDFSATSMLGGLATSVTVRNIGPVLIAFLLAGRVGAFTSAELATMKVTDQISAIEMLGIDVFQTLLAPRFIACVISSFLLLLIGLVISILGGLFVGEFLLGVNRQEFLSNVPKFLSLGSLLTGGVKSLFFGILIGFISCYEGYKTEGGVKDVGLAVQRTSMKILVSILLSNFLISIWVSLVEEMFL